MSHTRTTTDAGPDYCAECTEAAGYWVKWANHDVPRHIVACEPDCHGWLVVTFHENALEVRCPCPCHPTDIRGKGSA